jgi:hypothetical protein
MHDPDDWSTSGPGEPSGTLPERPAATEGERTELGALERFRTITQGALEKFQRQVRDQKSEPWAAAVQLRNTCEEAGLELQRTLHVTDHAV